MPQIRPFKGIHYARRADLDLGRVIAPPYDVLNERQKAALQARHPNNIVSIDLPHVPPKQPGPDDVYEEAAIALRAWLAAGVLQQDLRAALYPYSQSYQYGGRTFHRHGFICAVRLSPFGEGQVVPHELTYRGPIADRLKLMHVTGVQLSPIFGLFSDPKNEVTTLLYRNLAKPILSGVLEDVQNDLWSVTDAETTNQVMDLMRKRPIYIADGHHRYTTALQYQQEIEQQHGSPLPPNHLANWCMFVLVSMQDPGLLILPTHRLIGGLESFDIDIFRAEVRQSFDIVEEPLGPNELTKFADAIAHAPPHTFGLYDGRARKLYRLTLTNLDLLKPLEPDRSEAWRRLDVAILQRYLLDEALQPAFAAGRDLTRGYTADAAEIPRLVTGETYQIALLLQATPLHALEELGKTGEVMPQKSTYFYPKLATGMMINPLQP